MLQRSVMELLINGAGESRRFTQDSPVLPEVWIQYGLDPDGQQDLLLTPHRKSTAAELAALLRHRLAEDPQLERGIGDIEISYTRGYVVVPLYFRELVRGLLPLTPWWDSLVMGTLRAYPDITSVAQLFDEEIIDDIADSLSAYRKGELDAGVRREELLPLPHQLLWMMRIVGSIAYTRQRGAEEPTTEPDAMGQIKALATLLQNFQPPAQDEVSTLWVVNRNRPVELALKESRKAVKADAAQKVFDLDHSKLNWAIIDSGVDARHPAFLEGSRNDDNWGRYSRIKATYDFSRLRPLLDPNNHNLDNPNSKLRAPLRELLERSDPRAEELKSNLAQLKSHLLAGRALDWDLLEPLLRIPHDDTYQPPPSDHGTHVAGILGADWREGEKIKMQGVCPDIRMYDLRVLDENGQGDEFGVLGALQFIRHLNERKDYMVVHGANLSLSLRHDVANYACGRTPVCDECERVTHSGVVVVAAAGNLGYLKYKTATGEVEAYQSASITDPGNASDVITVGATHRYRAHAYGVSYFSSRGPTGDGRFKPDLVAPGEKITAPTPEGGSARKDGTSMAAPHVSGAAAALMARHREFIGKPDDIKQILCDTATDLDRERYFQGAGMVDILRALQSI